MLNTANMRILLFVTFPTIFLSAKAEKETIMKMSKKPALANFISFAIGRRTLKSDITRPQNNTANTGSLLEFKIPKNFGKVPSFARLKTHLLMPYITIRVTENVAEIAASNMNNFKQ